MQNAVTTSSVLEKLESWASITQDWKNAAGTKPAGPRLKGSDTEARFSSGYADTPWGPLTGICFWPCRKGAHASQTCNAKNPDKANVHIKFAGILRVTRLVETPRWRCRVGSQGESGSPDMGRMAGLCGRTQPQGLSRRPLVNKPSLHGMIPPRSVPQENSATGIHYKYIYLSASPFALASG